MRKQAFAVLTLATFILLPSRIKGQSTDDPSWPRLGNPEQLYHQARPRFIIESRKLEAAPDVSTPFVKIHCYPNTDPCRPWGRAGDFFADRKFPMSQATPRPGVMVKFYPHVLFDWHTGTYVFYLTDYNLFYLQGNCAMGHSDDLTGPFKGDPRIVLKKLADDPQAIAELGYLTVPFQPALTWSSEAWPAIPESGIEVSKLERAQGVSNPLSLDRCSASSEPCVLTVQDFSSKRPNVEVRQRQVLRPDVIAHLYDGHMRQYIFYLPERNIFYVTGQDAAVLGPFAGDPRVVFKRLAAGQTPSGSPAVSPCTLTREQSPEIRGLRLGMSAEQLLGLFPDELNRQRINGGINASKRPEAYGAGNIEVAPNEKNDNPRFEGVKYISIGLLDDRVVRFHVAYAQVQWKSVDQFVQRLSEGLRLPKVPWEGGNGVSWLNCNGFKIEAYSSTGPGDSVVRVMDTSVNKIVEDRKEAEKEKVRQAFRP